MPEIQALVQAADAALATIEAYNNGDGTAPAALTVAQYQAVGVSGVNADNLAAINAKVLAQDAGQADSAWEIQGLVAQQRLQAYAQDETTLLGGQAFLPQASDYLDAHIAGVTDSNLELINRLLVGASGADTETQGEIQHLVNTLVGLPTNAVVIDHLEANGVVISDRSVVGNDSTPDVVLDVHSAMAGDEVQLWVDGQQVFDHILTSAEVASGELTVAGADLAGHDAIHTNPANVALIEARTVQGGSVVGNDTWLHQFG